MYLSRRYVVALVVAIVGLTAYVMVPKVATSINAQQARSNLAAATADVARLRVPVSFMKVGTMNNDTPCPSYRCYRVAMSPQAVAPKLPAVLASVGVPNPADGVCTVILPTTAAATETCRTKTGVCSANPQQYPPTGPCQPTHGSCALHYRVVGPPWEHCNLYATIHDNNVVITLEPYFACRSTGPPCRSTNDAQVLIYAP